LALQAAVTLLGLPRGRRLRQMEGIGHQAIGEDAYWVANARLRHQVEEHVVMAKRRLPCLEQAGLEQKVTKATKLENRGQTGGYPA
jgi:hypothetical protein